MATTWTDPNLISNVTKTKKIHIEEIRLAINNLENNYAPKDSPALTGVPTAPTAAAATANTQIATTAFVKLFIGNKITVSATAPANPSVNDIWIDIS